MVACIFLAACQDGRVTVEPDGRRAHDSTRADSTRADSRRATTAAVAAGAALTYTARAPTRRSGSLWYPVSMEERKVLQAIGVDREVKLPLPSGEILHLAYERHIEHQDGNWTWVGRLPQSGGTAVLTFGPRAMFGSVQRDGAPSVELTTLDGSAWLVETRAALASGDALGVDALVAQRGRRQEAASTPVAAALTSSAAAATATASSTVDLVLGYTTGYANRLGGTSQAITRLNHLIDITNQAYIDSKVDGEVRLVRAVQVNYPDATSNQTALFELTGVSCTTSNTGSVRFPDRGLACTTAARPAALAPLITAREQYGADLVSLVRVFTMPENGSCGVAWLLGAGQTTINAADAAFAFSVVSDSSGNQFPSQGTTCREDYLGHEMGHNMGLQHDVVTAQGTDDTNEDGNLLDPEEFGALSFAFGYRTDASSGNFYTLMAVRGAGQTGYRIFSNPRILACGGFPCGNASTADNARALGQTMPLVANFRRALVPIGANWLRGDFNGDHKADIFWRNNQTGANTIWLSANAATQQAAPSVTNLAWDVVGVGDFDGDGRSDLLWRNSVTGGNTIWRAGNASAQLGMSALALDWTVVGVGDFDGDGRSDILWRNRVSGANVLWRSASARTGQWLVSVPDQAWVVAGIGDFDEDGRDDVLWRDTVTGQNTIWKAANAYAKQWVSTVGVAWRVAGVGDFDGDGKADIHWRSTSGGNTIWKGANSATQQWVSTLQAPWEAIGPGDFNGDGKADLLWRDLTNGRNAIWKGGSSAAPQGVTSVPNLAWVIAG
jgi:peptidyl-Asp metalloendopeptidase